MEKQIENFMDFCFVQRVHLPVYVKLFSVPCFGIVCEFLDERAYIGLCTQFIGEHNFTESLYSKIYNIDNSCAQTKIIPKMNTHFLHMNAYGFIYDAVASFVFSLGAEYKCRCYGSFGVAFGRVVSKIL